MVEERVVWEVLRAETACMAGLPWFGRMNEPRRAVVVDLCCQLTFPVLERFHEFLSAARDEHFAHAGEMLRRSNWAHEHPKRAILLAYQMESGEWQ